MDISKDSDQSLVKKCFDQSKVSNQYELPIWLSFHYSIKLVSCDTFWEMSKVPDLAKKKGLESINIPQLFV